MRESGIGRPELGTASVVIRRNPTLVVMTDPEGNEFCVET